MRWPAVVGMMVLGLLVGLSSWARSEVPPAWRPRVQILAPLANATVPASSTVSVHISVVSHHRRIARVRLRVNNTAYLTDCVLTDAMYTCEWEVPSGTGQLYQLQAVARTSSKHAGLSPLVQVTSE